MDMVDGNETKRIIYTTLMIDHKQKSQNHEKQSEIKQKQIGCSEAVIQSL